MFTYKHCIHNVIYRLPVQEEADKNMKSSELVKTNEANKTSIAKPFKYETKKYLQASKLKSMAFLIPFLVFFILFWLIPILFGLYISLTSWNISTGTAKFVGLKNYLDILTPGNMYSLFFLKSLKNVIIFVLISVPPLVLVGLGLALLVDNLPQKLRPLYRTIFFISYSISVTAVAAIFKWLFNENGGFINNVIVDIGIVSEAVNWLTQQPHAWIVILVTTIWWTIGFNMILFVNALNDIDHYLYEAAALDGANFLQIFKNIILPSIKNVIVFVMITSTIASFNLYGQVLLITAGGPSFSTLSLIMQIRRTVFEMNQLGIGSAMAIVMGVIVFAMALWQVWITRDKEESRG